MPDDLNPAQRLQRAQAEVAAVTSEVFVRWQVAEGKLAALRESLRSLIAQQEYDDVILLRVAELIAEVDAVEPVWLWLREQQVSPEYPARRIYSETNQTKAFTERGLFIPIPRRFAPKS